MLRYANALFAIVILILCTVAEAKRRGGFLFICIGDCAWWEYLLMALSVIIFSCCCWLCRCHFRGTTWAIAAVTACAIHVGTTLVSVGSYGAKPVSSRCGVFLCRAFIHAPCMSVQFHAFPCSSMSRCMQFHESCISGAVPCLL